MKEYMKTLLSVRDGSCRGSRFCQLFLLALGLIVAMSWAAKIHAASFDTTQFEASSYRVSEQDGKLSIVVTRLGKGVGTLAVQVVAGGELDTATEADYVLPPSTVLEWADGDMSSKSFDIGIVRDSLVEGDETLTLLLFDVLQPQEIIITDRANSPLAVVGTPRETVVTIVDSTPDPAAVEDLKGVSGNYQRGVQGETLNPFVVTAVNASGAPVAGVYVSWELQPATGGSLTQGISVTDSNGQSSNTLTLNTSESMVVRATVAAAGLSNDIAMGAVNADGSISVDFLVNGGLADVSGLTENQKSVAKALDTACAALDAMGEGRSAKQDDLLATCTSLKSGGSAALGASLDLLGHEEVSAQGRVILDTAKLQSSGIHRRLASLRAGSRGLNLSGLSINVDGKALPVSVIAALFSGAAKGGSAGEESSTLARRWGVFINADVVGGDRSKTSRESGYDVRARGITAGADYRISNDLVVGSALGYSKNNSDFENDTGSLEVDNLNLSAYGSYYQSASFYLDGLLRVGKNDIDAIRRISLSGNPLQQGIGSTDGREYAASVSAGYEFSRNALTLTPYGRLGYVLASIDGYTESASNPGGVGAGSVLAVGKQDVDSLTSVVGGRVAYAISSRTGVYLLQLNGEWEHEYKDSSRGISAQFVYDPTRTRFDIYSDNPDRDFFNLGMGVTGVFANGKSGFIYYESRLGQDNVKMNWINAGMRFEL